VGFSLGRVCTHRYLAVVLFMLVALSNTSSAGQQSSAGWSAVWDAVDAWKANSTENAATAPNRIRQLAVGRGDPLRSALLGALLDPSNDADSSSERALSHELKRFKRELKWPFSARESWLVAGVLDVGPQRSRALAEAMSLTPRSLTRAEINQIYLAGVEAAEDLRLDEALSIQQPLHDLAGAEWSAMNLAMTLRRRGHYERADRVLGDQIRANSSADLFAQRGLNALAAGDEARSRTYFGAALSKGSKNAAVNLARLDLAANRLLAARSGFRAVFVDSPESAWALRGWGIAQLKPLPASSKEQ
jgi:hypothetical protein